jgi:KUP system potassium uptake protein
MLALTLGALGVVFGDIGTSPLYALQAVFSVNSHAVHVNQGSVYGVISLVFWAITMIVSIKYVSFIMRADNGGEGGIMALTALLDGAKLKRHGVQVALVALGMFGASLFYGDGVITPAISVLSAISGLKVASPSIGSLVVPIAVVVLALVFAIQHYGTSRIGDFFGPVMVLWFGVLALTGAIEVAEHPAIIKALSPTYAAQFCIDHWSLAFIALASVVLAVTGAEALYADMGQFGRAPIRRAWFLLVFPALTLDYLAQGSLILRSHAAIANPFFLLLPGWARIPMVALATAATIIASQAVISGAFSVTRQAVQLGFLPWLSIRQTSDREVGQIYVPAVNTMLFVAVLAIVIGFGSSVALASAYGVAVTGTFILNTVLFLAVARLLWHKSRWLIALGAVVFLTTEVTFFAANLTKVVHGGWLPLTIALAIFVVMLTWRQGQRIVIANRAKASGSLRDFVNAVDRHAIELQRVPGTSAFLSAHPTSVPLALRTNVQQNHVLHERVLIVVIHSERVPHVAAADRLSSENLGLPTNGITMLRVKFGFHDTTDVPAALNLAAQRGLLGEKKIDVHEISYFLSGTTIVPTRNASSMSRWRKKLFLVMVHNASSQAQYFKLPDKRTVIMGERIHL